MSSTREDERVLIRTHPGRSSLLPAAVMVITSLAILCVAVVLFMQMYGVPWGMEESDYENCGDEIGHSVQQADLIRDGAGLDLAEKKRVPISSDINLLTIRGSVSNRQTGNPVPAAQIVCLTESADGREDRHSVETSEMGIFTLEVPTQGGDEVRFLHLKIAAQGYRSLETRIALGDLSSREVLKFYLDPVEEKRLVVCDSGGNGVSDAEVVFYEPLGGEIYLRRKTAVDGSLEYSVDEVPPMLLNIARLKIFVHAENMCDLIYQQRVGGDRILPDRLRLMPAASIKGHVRERESGSPIGDASIMLFLRDKVDQDVARAVRGRGDLKVRTTADGTFEIPFIERRGLSAPELITYSDAFLTDTRRITPADLDLAAGIEITLQRVEWDRWELYRAVVAGTGEPLRSMNLICPTGMEIGEPLWRGQTDEKGFFSVPKSRQVWSPTLFMTEDGSYRFSTREMKCTWNGVFWRAEFERIFMKSVNVSVMDDFGQGIEHATVFLVEESRLNRVDTFYRYRAVTDRAGVCKIPIHETRPVSFCAFVRHPQYLDYVSEPFQVGKEDPDTLGGQEKPASIEISCRLKRASFVQNVSVVDEQGVPQPEVTVVFEDLDGSGFRIRAKTDGRGICDAYLPPFQACTVSVDRRPDTRRIIHYQCAAGGRGVTLVCPSVPPLDWSICGKIVDETGEPIRNACITVVGAGYRRIVTNSDGTFRACVEKGRTYDLIIQDLTPENGWWYNGLRFDSVYAGTFEKIVLKRVTGIEVHVKLMFDHLEGRLMWNDLWLEDAEGHKVICESTRDRGSRTYFFGVPPHVRLCAKVRLIDGTEMASGFIQLEEGKSRVLVIE